MCLYPKLIINRKYTANKKNGGNIPAIQDERIKYVPIGCGRCIECMKRKARDWQIRLLEEIRTSNKKAYFVTLTFSDESIAELAKLHPSRNGYDLDNQILTMAVRRFLERYRKENKKSLRHWLISELGGNGTENIHAHGIIWTENPEDIEKHWKYGYVWLGKQKNGTYKNYVTEKTVNYIIKYVNKTDTLHKNYKPIVLTSPGIGNSYTKRQDALRTVIQKRC